jgi:dTDP-4-dehydrorhamnose 3,5-epimerase/CDP-3, 6-dideoxy-D-glycero-D-glycero-4-hexulose-5-epimerase
MHFQMPPHDHVKVVYCAAGAVLDVLLDLRAGSAYGNLASAHLSGDEPHILWIPKGIAHGFLSLTDNSLMIYKTSSEHAPTHDAGIRYDSFGFNWAIDDPILSDRDRQHIALADFTSPFST